jgi:hypothetical protein
MEEAPPVELDSLPSKAGANFPLISVVDTSLQSPDLSTCVGSRTTPDVAAQRCGMARGRRIRRGSASGIHLETARTRRIASIVRSSAYACTSISSDLATQRRRMT